MARYTSEDGQYKEDRSDKIEPWYRYYNDGGGGNLKDAL